MKKISDLWVYSHPALKKLIRELKIAFLIIVISVSNLFATPTYSQVAKVSLDMESRSLEQVINEIEHQSEFYFIFNKKQIDVNRVVDIQAENKLITDILPQLFNGTNVNYTVLDRKILLTTDLIESQVQVFESNSDVQQLIISGTVTDVATGEAMAGVNIQVKGTTIGAISDIKGKYTIPSSVDTNGTLVFSFIGYITQEASVAGKTVINMALSSEVTGLDEVVVIGYGTATRKSISGSVASVSEAKLKTTTNTDMSNMLSGKLPGLRTLQRTGEPGDYATNIDIRGLGTALVIIDGVPRSNFNRLDPNEVESVTILKDAAASVYGVRAANGVILVTTKKGSKQTPTLTYSALYGLVKLEKMPEMLNAYQWATLKDEVEVNNGRAPLYTKDDLAKYQDGTYPSTSWESLGMRNTAPEMQHNISASGGTDMLRFFTSIGYLRQEGHWKTGDPSYNRYNVRLNLTSQISKNLSVEMLLNGMTDKKLSARSTDIVRLNTMQLPITPVFANNTPPYYSNVYDGVHPLIVTNRDLYGTTDVRQKLFQGTLSLNYKAPFIKGLSARGMFNYGNTIDDQRIWLKKYAMYDYNSSTEAYKATYGNSPSTLTYSSQNTFLINTQVSLNYEGLFGKSRMKGLLLFETNDNRGDGFSGKKEFLMDAVDQLYAGSAANQVVNSGSVYRNTNMGLVGRFNYDYSSKYLAEFSFRYDGSSKFGEGNQWGFFPAISLSWRLNEEGFIKDNLGFIDNLKLRGSYGILGDDAASTYQFMGGYTYSTGNFVYGSVIPGLGFRNMPNQAITWYTSAMTNLGLDADLWERKLSMSFDIFQRNRTGLLATRLLSLPDVVGVVLPQENLNGDQTKGFEIELGHNNTVGNFTYSVSANMSFTRSKNKYMEERDKGNSYLNWRGLTADRWQNLYWGYNMADNKIFTSTDEIFNYPVIINESRKVNDRVFPGDYKFDDRNGDGIITELDMFPKYHDLNSPLVVYGIDLSMQWKGIDLNILFQGTDQFNVYFSGAIMRPLAWGRNGLSMFFDRWHREDLFDPTNTNWIPGKYPGSLGEGVITMNYTNYNEFLTHNAAYLRLKNIELGYTLPQKLYTRLGVQKLRIYTNAFNLLTFTGLKIVDPERSASYSQYPITKNYNFGISITF